MLLYPSCWRPPPAAACSLCTRSLDIALLIWLAYLPTGRAHGLLVAVHLLRMAVANATRPLMRSGAVLGVGKRRRVWWREMDTAAAHMCAQPKRQGSER